MSSAANGRTAGRPANSRTGIVLLSAIMVFVFFWLHRNAPEAPVAPATEPMTAVPDGFRASAWLLPDEPMLGFVEVPAGAFIMGSNPLQDPMAYENERWSAGRRQGNPELPAFFIGEYEVTVAQFNVFAGESGGRIARHEGEPTHPVSGVTWPEALAYGRWLGAQMLASGTTPDAIRQALDSGWRVTLPSEAQWEKAARGEDGRIFPWGSDPAAGNANFGGGELRAVTAGDCGQCSYGLADMAGNVWEMTSSPLQDYPFDPADDADALGADALFVMRGGSRLDGANNVRTAVRGAVDPGVRNPGIGFRLAITPP